MTRIQKPRRRVRENQPVQPPEPVRVRGGSLPTGLLLAGLLLYAGQQLRFLLFEASYFKLLKVDVEGTVALSKELVLRHSGLELGMLSFSVDDQEVRRRVEKHPKVASCRVEQPSPTEILLVVRERAEVARLVRDGKVWEVSDGGELMVESSPDSRSPLLLDAEVEEGPPARLVPRHLARMKTWFPVLAKPPTANFSSVRFGGGGRLDVVWRGIRMVVDDPDRFERHRSFLGPVMADARTRGLGFEYIDLRFQDVVVRYRALDAAPPAGAAGGGGSGAESVADPGRNPQNGTGNGELEAFMSRAAEVYRAGGPGAGP